MNGKIFIPVLLMALVMMTIFFVPVSGQEIDVDNMDNTELTMLLLQIMQRLDQSGKTAEMPEPTATPTPVPTEIPELSDDKAELEALMIAIMQKLQQEEPGNASEKSAGVPIPAGDPGEEAENSIWEDKKLIIEALPGYMFIQPTNPEPEPESKPNNTPTPVCPYPRTWGCDIHGNCACGLG